MKVLLSLLLALFVFVACSDEKKEDVLKVGMELAYPPFEMSDKNGKPRHVAKLALKTDEDRTKFDEGKIRMETRLKNRQK